MLPIVVIVGRPNVGKSTLFNRLLKRNQAITHDQPGVTRDRLYGVSRFTDKPFELVDTGGLVMEDPLGLEQDIMDQAREAIATATLALLVVDGREGPNALDRLVAEHLRRSGTPTLLVVNKVDNARMESKAVGEYYDFGFPLVGVSSSHGYNIGELIEQIEERLPEVSEEEKPVDESQLGLKLALLGKPNAGKSSLINAILGEKRLIVSPEAGTTRDSVDVAFEGRGKRYSFIDTAGVRRRSKIEDPLERFSVVRALKSSKRADVTLLVMDATEGVTVQDKKLLALMVKENTPLIAVINKIDLVAKTELPKVKKAFEEELRMASWVPVVYTSTVTKAGLSAILPLAEKLTTQTHIRISTGQLNRAMRDATEHRQAPLVNRRRAKFYYLTQTDVAPPTFVFFVNDDKLIKPAYAKYLEGQLRKLFNLRMTPINVIFRPSHGESKD